MIKTIRKQGERVDFNSSEMKKPMLDKKEREILKKEKIVNKKISDIENIGEVMKKAQTEINLGAKNLIEREKEVQKMANLWASLNNIKLNKLKKEDIKEMIKSQSGFIKELLEYYIENPNKKPKLGEDIDKLIKENKELKEKIMELERVNKGLMEEVDNALKEIERMQGESEYDKAY